MWTAPIQRHSNTWSKSTSQNHIIRNRIIFMKWCPIQTSDTELSYRYDSLMVVLHHWNDKSIEELSYLKVTSSQIEAWGDMWQLPSSNVIGHVIKYTSSHLGFGSGGQLLGLYNRPPTPTLHQSNEHTTLTYNRLTDWWPNKPSTEDHRHIRVTNQWIFGSFTDLLVLPTYSRFICSTHPNRCKRLSTTCHDI